MKTNKQDLEDLLDLAPEVLDMIIKGKRPSDMEYVEYKRHMRTSKKLAKAYLRGRAEKKDE